MTRRASLALSALVVALLAVRLVRMESERYSTDAVHYLASALRASSQPSALLEPDYIGRRHPLFLGVTALVERTFGPSLVALAVLAYAGHLAATLLLGRLAVRLGASLTAGATAAFVFAVFGGANNVFADPIHFARTWNLALALAALVALLAGRPWLYVGLYALSLLNFEDAVLLPLAALALERLAPHDRLATDRGRARAGDGDGGSSGAATGRADERAARTRTPAAAAHGAAHVVTFALLASAALLAATGPAAARPLALGAHVATKAALLPVEVARAALVLRSDVVAALLPRLAMALVALACLLPRARDVRVPRRTAIAFLVLGVALALPYLARPAEGTTPSRYLPLPQGTWPSRYLYFPAAPLLALAGLVASATPLPRRAIGLGILAAVGLTTTEAAADVIAARHLHGFTSATPHQIVELAAVRLEPTTYPSPAPAWLDSRDCAFLAGAHLAVPLPCDALVPVPPSDTLTGGDSR